MNSQYISDKIDELEELLASVRSQTDKESNLDARNELIALDRNLDRTINSLGGWAVSTKGRRARRARASATPAPAPR